MCDLCKMELANSVEGLKNHNIRFHGGITPHSHVVVAKPVTFAAPLNDGSTGRMGSKRIMPIKLSGRSRERIVEEMEWMLGAAIVPDTRPVKF